MAGHVQGLTQAAGEHSVPLTLQYHRLNDHEFEQTLGDGEGWSAAVCGVAKSRTRLSD